MHFAAFLVLHIYGGFLLFLCFDFVTDFSVFMFIYIYIYIHTREFSSLCMLLVSAHGPDAIVLSTLRIVGLLGISKGNMPKIKLHSDSM